jgi:hypothetical protein
VCPYPDTSGLEGVVATAINDSDQVVGYGYIGTNPLLFVGRAAGVTPITLPAGWSLNGLSIGINGSGQIVGFGSNSETGFSGIVVLSVRVGPSEPTPAFVLC